jgi:hypothetical protein
MMTMPPHDSGVAHGGSGEHVHNGNLHNFYHATMHVALLLACAAEAAERRWGAHGSVTRSASVSSSSSSSTRVLVPRGTGLVALAYTLWLLIALFFIHTLLQEPTEALRHHLLVAPLALAAAAASADALAPRPAWLLARAYGLLLAGAWMMHMAASREYGWAAPYEAAAAEAAQTVAVLHFSWLALATATAVAVATALAPRGGGGSVRGAGARSKADDDDIGGGHNHHGGEDDDDEGVAVLPYERELRRMAA